MKTRKFSREFKLVAVRLVRDRDVTGFHAWLNHRPSTRPRYDEALFAAIDTSFRRSDHTYRARRVWRDVLAEVLSCRLHRIERLMLYSGLRARPAGEVWQRIPAIV